MHYPFSLKQIVLLSIIFITPGSLFGATSTDFSLYQEDTTARAHTASSSDYRIDAAVGDTFVGVATSSDYVIRHGTSRISANTVTVSILFSTPQSRDTSRGDNYDSTYYITVRTSTNSDDVVLFTSELASSTASGASLGTIELTGIGAGTYDIGIKTNQTLTKVLQDVPLSLGNTTLNFSSTDYASITRGSEVLLAGDLDGAGTSNITLGDDLVNSIDLSVMLADLNDSDSDGNQVRANINQDVTVNSVDLSIILSNLNVEGDN